MSDMVDKLILRDHSKSCRHRGSRTLTGDEPTQFPGQAVPFGLAGMEYWGCTVADCPGGEKIKFRRIWWCIPLKRGSSGLWCAISARYTWIPGHEKCGWRWLSVEGDNGGEEE